MKNKYSNLLNVFILSIPVLLSIMLFSRMKQTMYTHLYGEGGVYVSKGTFVFYTWLTVAMLYAASIVVETYFGYVAAGSKFARLGFSLVFSCVMSALIFKNLI